MSARGNRAADIAELFELYVPLAPRFLRSSVAQGNRHNAIAELHALISVVNATLHETPQIPVTKRNKELVGIWNAAYKLRDQLRPNLKKRKSGYESVLQQLGIFDSRLYDTHGEKADIQALLNRLSRDLDKLIVLTTTKPLPRSKGGSPGDARRDRAAQDCAVYFSKWTGQRAVDGDDSNFSVFLSAVFEHLGQARAKNLRRRIKKLPRVRT